MRDKLQTSFKEAVNTFVDNKTHSNFEEIVRTAFAINPEIATYLKEDCRMPIRVKGDKLKFGSQTRPFDTIPEKEMSRAALNLRAMVS